jgi:hypothetical protein
MSALPAPDDLAARRNVRPFLHRATGQISFRPLKDEAARAQPASLCAFLIRHGIQAEVVEEVPTMPDLYLDGGPNPDRVQALIDHWLAGGDPADG